MRMCGGLWEVHTTHMEHPDVSKCRGRCGVSPANPVLQAVMTIVLQAVMTIGTSDTVHDDMNAKQHYFMAAILTDYTIISMAEHCRLKEDTLWLDARLWQTLEEVVEERHIGLYQRLGQIGTHPGLAGLRL